MSISKEFKIGLLTVVAISTLYWGFNYLKGINTFSSINHFYIVYDSIGGLQEGNQVMIRGFSVGRVGNISLSQKRNNRLLVELEVKNHIKLHKGTAAQLVDAGFLGGKVINLVTGNGMQILQDGDTLLSELTPSLAEKMSAKVEPIINNLDSITRKVDTMIIAYTALSYEVKNMLFSVQDNLNTVKTKLNNTLNNTSAAMKSAKTNLDLLSTKLVQITDSIHAMPLASLTKELQKTSVELNKSMKALNKAEGSMGKMLYDPKLYDNLNQTIRDLDSLFVDLKASPKRYVHFSIFGKKEKKKK